MQKLREIEQIHKDEIRMMKAEFHATIKRSTARKVVKPEVPNTAAVLVSQILSPNTVQDVMSLYNLFRLQKRKSAKVSVQELKKDICGRWVGSSSHGRSASSS
jgi:hypothetical protein